MCSFKIRDRQTAVLLRPLSADCVGIAGDCVLGVAERVLTVGWVDVVRACSLWERTDRKDQR